MLEGIFEDLRYGIRLMLKTPGVTALAVLALALGIGANTAIFSAVRTVLYQPLPVADPDRLVAFSHFNERRNLQMGQTPYPDVCIWRTQLKSFETIAAQQQTSATLAHGSEPERVNVGKVNASFFPMLGVQAAQGRTFVAEEDRPGGARVAILTYELWQRSFGAQAGALGSVIRLDDQSYTIVGVLPGSFRFVGRKNDLYLPLALAEVRGPGTGAVSAYGRLKPGVSREQAGPELEAASAATAERTPPYKGWRIQIGHLRDWVVADVRTSLLAILGAVTLALLLACSNVAGVLLTRAASRRREIAVRAALGATRRRLLAQFLVESIPLALAGALVGVVFAWWGIRILSQFELSRIPRLHETRLDSLALLFTAGVSIVTCVLAGLIPALFASRADVQDALRDDGRSGTTGVSTARLRGALVVAEVAIAVALTVGATLMIRTFQTLSHVHPGFNPENLLTASIELPRSQFREPTKIVDFYGRAMDRMRSIPGVLGVTSTSSLPLGGNYYRADFRIEGHEYADPRDIPVMDFRIVDADYFRVMGIRLLRGRFFNAEDRDGAPPAAIISETTARRLFANEDAIGKRFSQGPKRISIVGVVADVRHTDIAQLSESEVLLPLAQAPAAGMTFAIRVDSKLYPDPMRFAPILRQTVSEIDKNQAVYRVASMEKIMSDRLSPRRLNMILLVVFAGVSVLLSCIGVYSVLATTVETRTHEIGIRMAIGAEAADVIRMVARQALMLTVIGLLLGVGIALGCTRILSSVLYGVSATEPLAFIFAGSVLLAAAALAAYLPVRRAVRVDPLVALRCE